jgi:hypothetical protein
METKSLLQSFAIDKDGRVHSIDEVTRGLACDCVCSVCGERLIARQGEVREWHFAHASGADCAGSAESALHAAAKQLLIESGGMTVPEVCIRSNVVLPDGRTGTGEVRCQELWLDFESAEAEKPIGNLRPDVVASVGSYKLCIEVAVTHFVGEEKRREFEALCLPAIEINLAGMERERWTWEILTDVVIESAAQKSWLYIEDRERLQEEARQAAMQVALSKTATIPPGSRATAIAPRTRFWVGRRMVDVIERPFGLAVWCPYDPALNELIKGLIRPLGGRWQPKFKNWLVPCEAKEYLFRELTSLTLRPPDVR